jgi:hypothetical protein
VFAELAKAYTLGTRNDLEPIGVMSMAEGHENAASARRSHAEGSGNTIAADAPDSHAEGSNNTIAIGTASHAEGADNRIEASFAHAEGNNNQAMADFTHVEGEGNIAEGVWQHVFGRYNVADTSSYEIVGNGSNDNNRANIRTLDPTGKEWLNDTLEVSRDPTAPFEVATKNYVDNSGGGTVTAKDVTVDGSDFAQNPEWSEALAQSENVQEALTYLSLIAYDTTDQVIALEGSKQDGLISGSNIKTINGNSILGSGNLVIGGGGGTSDYSNLTNKPKINSVELSGNKSLSDLGITLGSLGGVPTTRTVNSKALSSDITLTASDVGALPDTTSIPSKTSDLTNDSGFVTGSGSQSANYTSVFTIGNMTVITGNAIVNVDAANTNCNTTVHFNHTFKYIPVVLTSMLNIGGSYYMRCTAAGSSTTGFTARVRAGAVPNPQNINVQWVAIGELV